MDRRIVLVLVAVIVGAAISGTGAQAGEANPPLTKLNFGAPTTPPNLVHITPWVAKEQGFFVEEGLDVEITTFEGGVYVIRNVVSDSLTYSASAGAAAIISAAKKAGIKDLRSGSAI
jgi:ABC-type nitrate/sulfonate/bicarbonate transport system substrate-binding protein